MPDVVTKLHGFRPEYFRPAGELIEPAANGQKTPVLLMTCCDLGVDPHALLPAVSESLYVLQNAGNLVPAHDGSSAEKPDCQVSAALALYRVKDIVVCGHASCGVIRWLLGLDRTAAFPSFQEYCGAVAHRLALVRQHYRHLEGQLLNDSLAAENVLLQLQNLLTIPAVAQRLARGELHLHGWFLQGGRIHSYDPVREAFVTGGAGK